MDMEGKEQSTRLIAEIEGRCPMLVSLDVGRKGSQQLEKGL